VRGAPVGYATRVSIAVFQLLCVAVLLVAYGIALRQSERPAALLRDIGLLVVAAWLAEQTCILQYRMYAYNPDWWPFIGEVPLLIPLIWPMVLLSAREVVTALWPGLGVSARAAAVGGAVAVDASLMEIIATASGLWRWAEPGYLDVPLIGILGWGCFAVAVSLWMDLSAGASTRARALRWALPAVALAATHALLVALWWGGLRWGLRGDLGGWAVVAFGVLLVPLCVHLLGLRRRRRLAPATTVSRVVAASVFFALLVTLDHERAPWLWLHTALVAVPYLLVVGPRAAAPAAPRPAGPGSR